ncbi:MAG: hypothetical protein DRR19_18935 [Candidatus Parabeggiatoa sp. nov. 1]|nr:MAG: hypothetical protein DRR19_18935 [Gammaproteobacteria bacterium]
MIGNSDDGPYIPDLIVGTKGEVKNTLYNVAQILTHHPDWEFNLGFDVIARNIHKFNVLPFENAEPGTWLETDLTAVRMWFVKEYGIQPTITDTLDGIRFVAHRHKFNPMAVYLDGLTWDGVPRIDTFCETYLNSEVKRAYKLFIRAFFIGAAGRQRYPGSKMDIMLLLIGPQGCRKSSMIVSLFGKDRTTDTPFRIPSQTMYMIIRGKTGIELGEFDKYSKSSVADIKAAITQNTDETRDPYARETVDVPRSCVFVGTTNVQHVLTDKTGNRRFAPVQVGMIDTDSIERDRDQLWAEADHYYAKHLETGEPWWFDEKDPDVMAEWDSASSPDAWEDVIQDWLQARPDLVSFHTSELYSLLHVTPASINQKESVRLIAIMVKYGYDKAPNGVSLNGVRKSGFFKCQKVLL